MEDIGVELWLLVERIAKKSPSSLIREISYRTNEPPASVSPSGSMNTHTAAKNAFRQTAAYQSLKERYAAVVKQCQTTFKLKAMRAALTEEFRDGLIMANSRTETAVLRAVQNVAESAIADVSPNFSAARFPQTWQVLGKALVGTSLTCDQLIQQIERIVITPNLPPSKWWLEDDKGLASVYKLTKVAMIKDPPTLELQYEVMPTAVSSIKPPKLVTGRRVLHLEEELQGSTHPAALALVGKKLAQSHGFLFRGSAASSRLTSPRRGSDMDSSMLRKTSADAEILKLLTKLHQLVKFGRVSSPTTARTSFFPTASDSGGFTKPPFPTQSAAEESVAVPQKADIGLLYRDPEAAMKNVDLNSADDYTVQEFKAKMSEGFASKVVKPGDPGYKYDLRVEMKTTGASEWDSD